MINKYGFPVKNYYMSVTEMAPPGVSNLSLIIKAARSLLAALVEKRNVSRRVSTYGRQQKPTYTAG